MGCDPGGAPAAPNRKTDAGVVRARRVVLGWHHFIGRSCRPEAPRVFGGALRDRGMVRRE